MKRLLYILAILSLIFPHWVFARVATPRFTLWSSGYGVDTEHAFTDGDPDIFVVTSATDTDTSFDNNSMDLNGTTVYYGGFLEAIDFHNNNATYGTIILFSVSGTLQVDDVGNGLIDITRDNLWIAGQSAPSPGFTIRNGMLRVSADDIFIQHIRIRMDDCGTVDGTDCGVAWDNRNAFIVQSSVNPQNIFIDHISVSFGTDENFSFSSDGTGNMTVHNSIIGFPLYLSNHSKGVRAKNSNMSSGLYVASVRNLYAHADDRSPYLVEVSDGSDSSIIVANNIVYNPGGYGIFLQDSASYDYEQHYSIINNYTKSGADTSYGHLIRFKDNGSGAWTDVDVYLSGNNLNGYTQSSADDWGASVVRESTIYADNDALETAVKASNGTSTTQPTPSDYGPIPSGYTPDVADSSLFNTVIGTTTTTGEVGARPTDRDIVDEILISDAINGTGHFVDTPEEGGGFVANDGDCTNNEGSCRTWDLATELNDNPYLLDNFPQDPFDDNTSAGYTEDGYDNIENWLFCLSEYWEEGNRTSCSGNTKPRPDCSGDPSCLGNYFDGSSVVKDIRSILDCVGAADPYACCTGDETGTCYDLNTASGETEWVNQGTTNGIETVGAANSQYYVCSAVADAGGITALTRMDVYPDNAGSLTGKTLTVYHNTQTGGVGNDLDATPGTSLGTLIGDNDFDYSAETIAISSQAFSQNELICFSMGEVDTRNYFKLKRNLDSEAKLGDVQRFNSSGVWQETLDRDFEIILYESAGNPPAYSNSVVDFDGTNDSLYQAVTSLHANMAGRTGKLDFGFVFRNINFDAFPTDNNEFTLIKLADAYDIGVKTADPNNYVFVRIYDGVDWDAEYVFETDLSTDTDYDIFVGWANTAHTIYIDIATHSNSTRIAARGESVEDDIDMNAPNSGNVNIGWDGSGEFFNGQIDTLFFFDDQLSATEFIDMSDGDWDPPAPSCLTWEMSNATYDSTDIGSYISGTMTWDREVMFSGCQWTIESGRRDMDCWMSGGQYSTIVTTTCGPIEGGMGIAALELSDSDITVNGLLKNDIGTLDATTTLPAITGTVAISPSIPFQSDNPAEIGTGSSDGYTTWSAFTLLASDHIKQVGNLSESITLDEAGVTWNGAGYTVRGATISGANCHVKIKIDTDG